MCGTSSSKCTLEIFKQSSNNDRNVMISKEPPIKYYVIAGFFTIFLGFGFTILPDIAESTNREYLFSEKFGMFLMTLGAVFTGIVMTTKLKNSKV